MYSNIFPQNSLFFLDIPVNVKYALLVLLNLADQNEMSANHFLSKPDLELICLNLQKGGLIDSNLERGCYFLKRQPWEITLLDVVRAMENKQSQAKSFDSYTPDKKLIHNIWQQARQAAQNTLQQYTLQDLCQKQNPYFS